jgi:hypothetical protein
MTRSGSAGHISKGPVSFSRTITREAPKESVAILLGKLHRMALKPSRLSKVRSLVLRASGGGTVAGTEEHQFICTRVGLPGAQPSMPMPEAFLIRGEQIATWLELHQTALNRGDSIRGRLLPPFHRGRASYQNLP